MSTLRDAAPIDVDRALIDFPYFCQRCLQIQLKSDLAGEERALIGPFIWNEAQWIIWGVMCDLIERGLPVRLVILKARQFGISTFFCAWLFWWAWRSHDTHCAIVAQSKNNTLENMQNTMRLFYESLPEDLRPALPNRRSGTLAKGGTDFADRRTSIRLLAAKKAELARGASFLHVLATEVAHYDDASEYFGALTPAMGERRDTTLVMESSPQPGWFWDQYRAGRGSKTQPSIFLPWFVVPSLYNRPLTKKRGHLYDAKTGDRVSFTREERQEQAYCSREWQRLFGKGPVSDEQLYWRQRKIHDPSPFGYDGDEEFFNQEFPRDDVTCFERSVRSAFRIVLPIVRASVDAVVEECADHAIGQLECETIEQQLKPFEAHEVAFVRERREGLIDFERTAGIEVFRKPEKGYTYTIGCDVADDMEIAADEDDACFSVASVYCCNTHEQVAEWRGSIDPHAFGDEIAKVGYYYNTAMVNVEYNNMGVTTVDRLVKYLGYPNRFKWPKFDEAGVLTKKEMWVTSDRTKNLMISALRHAIKGGLYVVRSVGLQEELTAYKIENGHYRVGRGAFADRIVAAALAWQCVEQTDYYANQVMKSFAVSERIRPVASGQAKRALQRQKLALAAAIDEDQPDNDSLPAEFDDLRPDPIGDLWEAVGL